MVTLLALMPAAHAWLGDDGVYFWSESGSGDADAPTHVWVDVPAEPGAVMLGISNSDDMTEPLTALGATSFYFYGREYQAGQIWASSNGLVLFADNTFVPNYCCTGQPIPAGNVIEPAIMSFWDDLNPSAGGEVWAVDTGAEIIVSWVDVGYFGSGGANSVQVGMRPDGSFRISVESQATPGNSTSIGAQRDSSTGNQAFIGTTVPAPTTWLFVPDTVDDDGDGYSDFDDCDDDDPLQNPGVVDTVCDGIVANCDLPTSELDRDGDGYRVCENDCDDLDGGSYPGANEFCDGRDNDCDSDIDEGFPLTVYFEDLDLDGWGDADGGTVDACNVPMGYGPPGDCDDDDPATNPFAPEDCDATVDRDCDGDMVAGATDTRDYQVDADGDGFGSGITTQVCVLPSDAATEFEDDCDDGDAAIFPDATETPFDDLDQNCDGFEARDRDFDGINDADEYELGTDWLNADTDGDGVLDGDEYAIGSVLTQADSDNDGVLDGVEYANGDSDGDGTPDINDNDDDQDGFTTGQEGFDDFDGDGIPNYLDDDSDADGILDVDETNFDNLFRVNAPPDTGEEDKGGCNTAASASAPAWLGLIGLLALGRRRA